MLYCHHLITFLSLTHSAILTYSPTRQYTPLQAQMIDEDPVFLKPLHMMGYSAVFIFPAAAVHLTKFNILI
jgi:hypothetical protein